MYIYLHKNIVFYDLGYEVWYKFTIILLLLHSGHIAKQDNATHNHGILWQT